MNLDDTIVAIATPAGRGGIGVVRLSGSRALEIARPLLRVKHDLEPGRAIFGKLVANPEHEGTAALGCSAGGSSTTDVSLGSVAEPQKIDEVVVTYFAKPHSYTTDDVIEISAHGSPVVLQHIV